MIGIMIEAVYSRATLHIFCSEKGKESNTMTKDEVLSILRDLGDERRKQIDQKSGAGENTYGVLRGELRKLVKQLGKNHELALELWQSGNTEAQWLSCIMLDAKKLTIDEIRTMASEVTYSELIDKFVGEVVTQNKSADALAGEWSASAKDNLGRAGWNLIVDQVSGGKMNDESLEALLATITAELQAATPGKQWAMNHALCAIGYTYPHFTQRCIALGETLGVYRDLKVSKGCTSAYAPNWIAAILKKK